MANGTLNVALKKDWLLANPWLWLGLGLALTIASWSTARIHGGNASDLRVIVLALGMLATGVGVHLRWHDRETVYLQGRATQAGIGARFIMGGVFLAAGLGLIVYFGVSCWYGNLPGWFPGATFLLCISVAPASLRAARRCLFPNDRQWKLDVDEEIALSLMLAGGVCVLGWYALYLGPTLADDWDTMRLFLRALAGVCLLGAALVLASMMLRRVTLSILFFLHFCAISNACMTVDPSPWLIKQSWVRLFRPYLEFMYLNNAYHFFAPDPGPSSYLWFRVIFTTPQGKDHGLWYKVPDLDEDGNIKHPVALEYQRFLAMTASVEPDGSLPSLGVWFDNSKDMWVGAPLMADRLNLSLLAERKNLHPRDRKLAPLLGQRLSDHWRIPLSPVLPWAQQVRIPNDQAKMLLSSYTRFVARKFAVHPENPDWEFKHVKVYRVTHYIPEVKWYRLRIPPTDPVLYRSFYSGLYDADGEQRFEQDPYLYWMLPSLRLDPNNPESDIEDYLRLHAGDENWFREGKTRIWQKHPKRGHVGQD